MRVDLRCHGIIADLLGVKASTLELPDGATVADLFAALAAGNADRTTILRQVRAVVDGRSVDRSAPLADGAQVTLMRAIAGGADCLRS